MLRASRRSTAFSSPSGALSSRCNRPARRLGWQISCSLRPRPGRPRPAGKRGHRTQLLQRLLSTEASCARVYQTLLERVLFLVDQFERSLSRVHQLFASSIPSSLEYSVRSNKQTQKLAEGVYQNLPGKTEALCSARVDKAVNTAHGPSDGSSVS